MANGDGVQFTVKEMLQQIDGKIDTLRAEIRTKAEHSDVIELRQKITALDASAIKRDGPVAAQIREVEARTTKLERELDRRTPVLERINEKADKIYVDGLKDDIADLSEKVDAFNARFLALFGTIALSFVGVALTVIFAGGH